MSAKNAVAYMYYKLDNTSKRSFCHKIVRKNWTVLWKNENFPWKWIKISAWKFLMKTTPFLTANVIFLFFLWKCSQKSQNHNPKKELNRYVNWWVMKCLSANSKSVIGFGDQHRPNSIFGRDRNRSIRLSHLKLDFDFQHQIISIVWFILYES